ncbi:MAG: ATP-binding protein [Proteobacteria bacterium]|nr:ATP-binding protein [Pseudomonadota bacterium]
MACIHSATCCLNIFTKYSLLTGIFSYRGRIEVVTKQTLRSNKAIKIEISDNGLGISTSDLPYIFDPFFSNKKKGTGLGLSNVKKIIEAHGVVEKVTLRKPQVIRFSFIVPFREIN